MPVYMKTIKVAKIINDRQLVITGGSRNGFQVGDLFEIYDPGTDVFDPDTGRKLGNLEYVKATIKASQVFDGMTLCVNAQDESSLLTRLAASFSYGPTAALNVSPDDISGGIDTKIHVGDMVRKVAKNSPTDVESRTSQESD